MPRRVHGSAKAPTELSIVLRARKVVAASGDAIDQLEERYASAKAMVADIRKWEQEDRERAAWYAGGPKPLFIQQRDAAELRRFMADCVHLPLPVKGSPHPMRLRSASASGPGLSSEQDPGQDQEAWVSMSIEDYIHSLEAPVAVEPAVSVTPNPKKQKTTWVEHFVSARKTRLSHNVMNSSSC